MKSVIKINRTVVTPMFTGRLKDLLSNSPLRSIVSCCVTLQYFLQKAFVIFLQLILPISDFAITSTKDFIHKIKQIPVNENTNLTNLDVVSL